MTTLLANGEQVFLSNAGVPLAGGSVFFYVPGTTTPKNTWQDSSQISLNTNPVILDSAGRAIIFGQGSYRQQVYDSLSNLIWDQLTSSADQGGIYSGTTSTGTAANQILATTTPSGFALTAGNQLTFLAGFTCTGATTLNANGTGAKNILKPGPTGPIALVAGDFGVGDALALFYDGTQFQLLDALALPLSGGSLTGALNIKRTASAATVVAGVLDISAISANFIQLSETGGGAITSLGAAGDGAWRMLDFTGAAPGTLTGSATMLIPTAGNIIPIQQNDTATFVWVGTVAVLVDYTRASGKAISGFVLLGNSETGAVATGSTVLPFDDTIPQSTEGDQYMSLTVTPNNSSSTLIIDVLGFFGSAVSQDFGMAIFQDATASALAATAMRLATGLTMSMSLRHKMTAGTTSATTFKVRAGGNNAGTNTFNGTSGGRIYGGIAASSITVTEILP